MGWEGSCGGRGRGREWNLNVNGMDNEGDGKQARKKRGG
jgi:hypothetical protein